MNESQELEFIARLSIVALLTKAQESRDVVKYGDTVEGYIAATGFARAVDDMSNDLKSAIIVLLITDMVATGN